MAMTLALAGWNNPQQHRAPEQQAGRSSGGETGPACDQAQAGAGIRDHICHKQYKQRLCKIIITRVKVHFVDVF